MNSFVSLAFCTDIKGQIGTGKDCSRPQKGVSRPEMGPSKSFYLCCNHRNDRAIRSPQLVDDLKAAFGLTAPLYRYLLETLTRVRPPR